MINCAGCGASVATPGLCYACKEAAKHHLPAPQPAERREAFEALARQHLSNMQYPLRLGEPIQERKYFYTRTDDLSVGFQAGAAWQSTALARENEALRAILLDTRSKLVDAEAERINIRWQDWITKIDAALSRLTTPAGGA